MNSRNDYIREYLGVDKFHAAGYTGKRVKALTGERGTDGHAADTRAAFREIAPDAEVSYAPFPSDASRVEMFSAQRGDACCMFVSMSSTANQNAVTDAAVPDDLFLCVSAGNYGEERHNAMMRPEKVYGVGAVEVAWSHMQNGKPAPDAKPVVHAADYSSESGHVDFAAPTGLYVSSLRRFTGTSCACPVLAGMAALVNDFFIAKTGRPLAHEAMYRFLKDHAEDAEIPGVDDKTGWGVPRLPDPASIDISKYQTEEPAKEEPEEEKPVKILLIAGHGAGDPGAVCGKYKEADETRMLVRSLVTELSRYGADVSTYPLLRDAFADYKAGALVLPEADFVLEVHFNAFATDPGDGKTKGVECYVTTTEKNMAPAEAICRAVAALGFTNRGVKQKNYAVLSRAKAVGATAALLETCFLDDADDMALYEKHREQVAAAISEAVANAFDLVKQELTVQQARQIVQEKAGLENKTMDYLAAYEWGRELIEKLAKAMQ